MITVQEINKNFVQGLQAAPVYRILSSPQRRDVGAFTGPEMALSNARLDQTIVDLAHQPAW